MYQAVYYKKSYVVAIAGGTRDFLRPVAEVFSLFRLTLGLRCGVFFELTPPFMLAPTAMPRVSAAMGCRSPGTSEVMSWPVRWMLARVRYCCRKDRVAGRAA